MLGITDESMDSQITCVLFAVILSFFDDFVLFRQKRNVERWYLFMCIPNFGPKMIPAVWCSLLGPSQANCYRTSDVFSRKPIFGPFDCLQNWSTWIQDTCAFCALFDSLQICWSGLVSRWCFWLPCFNFSLTFQDACVFRYDGGDCCWGCSTGHHPRLSCKVNKWTNKQTNKWTNK